jgi:diguanylate cyclase (GGDEF)-like protein
MPLPAAVGRHGNRLLLIGLVAGLAFALSHGRYLQRIDYLAYDILLTLQGNQASPQVVIAAIDDESLHRVGRWPWSRMLQAQLLDRITDHGARAVGIDILLSEAQRGNGDADRRLANALQRNGRAVLAVAPSQPARDARIEELLPLPLLAAASAGLGHVDVEIDVDGICRSFFTHAGLGDAHWPALALAVLRAGGGHVPAIAPPGPQATGSGWRRYGRYYVPYDARPDAVKTVSAHDLLSGADVGTEIEGRYVLIGSTATGLGDMLATPVSFDHRRMAGVELTAHILSGLIHDSLSRDLTPLRQHLLSLLLAASGAALIVSVSFPLGAILLFAIVVLITAISALLLVGAQLWFAPAAAIAPLVLCFPLWGAWCLLREQRINRTLAVRMRHQALHHAVTGLPNQYLLDERLRALRAEPASGRMAALMIIHISRSRSIGDLAGWSASDELLCAIASCLCDAVRSGDLVTHLSGDDFGILVEDLDSVTTAGQIADGLMQRLREPMVVEGASLYLSPRMGVSLWPRDASDGPALLRNAYVALFCARIEGEPAPCVYSSDMGREVAARSQLEQALSLALERNEFEVYYQPQVRSGDNRLIGVEALLRWHSKELGLVYPGTFIPVAEQIGLIQRIGGWVLRTACDQVEHWNSDGLGPLRVAVNLSPLQFMVGDLVGEVRQALTSSGLDPAALELEITESALIQNLPEARQIMHTLKALGIKLSIDDFGTGYSSLSHLQHLPFDRIKIDRSFVHAMQENPDVREITLTIIGMAKRLNMQVVAEGVETDSQLGFLNEHGCDELQGFLFSHPLPAADLSHLLRADLPLHLRQGQASQD